MRSRTKSDPALMASSGGETSSVTVKPPLNDAKFAALKRLASKRRPQAAGDDEQEITAQFGSIRFADSRTAPSKFVRIDNKDMASRAEQDVQVENVLDLLLTTWQLKPPCAIISIPPIKNVDASEELSKAGSQLELIIRRGIAEAVHKTSAWVITGGNGDNVTARLVGRAMQYGRSEFGHAFTCIGVVPWNHLVEHKNLSALSNGAVLRYGGTALERSNRRRSLQLAQDSCSPVLPLAADTTTTPVSSLLEAVPDGVCDDVVDNGVTSTGFDLSGFELDHHHSCARPCRAFTLTLLVTPHPHHAPAPAATF
jgi:hypothetical protein